MIPLFKVLIDNSAIGRIEKTLTSGWIGEGDRVLEFEKHLEMFFGVSVLATNSCTSALELAFDHISRQVDRKGVVLTTPLTCFATTAAILHAGLDIRWVDIDPTTLNVDMNDLQSKMTEDVVAVSIVHFGGRPCPLPDTDKFIVEDCAQAFGSYDELCHVGTHPAVYGCFSFQSVKTLTTGDGGALKPPKAVHYELKRSRWYGMDRDLPRSQNISVPGFKYHMNDLSAALGLANFSTAVNSLKIQRDNARYYSENLEGLTTLPYNDMSSNYLFPLLVEKRDAFIYSLKDAGIEASPVHFRNDKNSCVEQYKADLPRMDYVEPRLVFIPNGWWVTPEDREHIVHTIRKGW